MTVLHVDRSSFFQKVVKNTNRRDGVEFISCNSISDARETLKDSEIELIITGQQLTDGSAKDFLSELAISENRDIPVIIITSTDDFKTREEYFNLGVVDFISKSQFSPERLDDHLGHFEKQDSLVDDIRNSSMAVIDDSHLSLNVISSIFKIFALDKVDLYKDPVDFLEKGKEYDIYFVDLMLPNISGEQIIIELRKKRPHAVIIAVSSLDKFNTIVHVLESGADDYIIKPFDARFLMARLKSNFRHHQLLKELQSKTEILEKAAITDCLTGVYNHRYLFEKLNDLSVKNDEEVKDFAVLLLDIDRFKIINDTYGHPAGDEVLKAISSKFLEHGRQCYTFGRYGGEEFMLIMEDTDLEEAHKFAEFMRMECFSMVLPDLPVDQRVSFSGGLVHSRNVGIDTDILKKADAFLYQAKESGRNKICY